jgi:lactose/L-arabinose transport system ATP-binding protein
MNFIEGEFQQGPAFVADQVRADLSTYDFGSALGSPGGAPAPGTRVVLGVRPEHLRLRAGGPARVALVETLGSHSLVWVDAGASRLCALEGSQGGRWTLGEGVCLEVDAGAASLFAVEDGCRLGGGWQ